MTKLILSLILAIILSTVIVSLTIAGDQPDFLEPESGIFSGTTPFPYYLVLRDLLLGEHEYRQCQAFVLPSFEPEWAVYLVRTDETTGEARVVYTRMKNNLWYEMFHLIQKNTNGNVIDLNAEHQKQALSQLDKPIDLASALISGSTSDLLEQIWGEMLSRVHYRKVDLNQITVGLDGVTYHFSHYQKWIGLRAGTTWSPDKGNNTAALVELAEELQRYAKAEEKDRHQIEITIHNKAKSLLEKLK